MEKIVDSRFERLEKALTSLIDSVNKYHPSAQHAQELEAADNELSKCLEEVQTHQNNYLRIQELRKSSAALDAQIRDTLTSLASTRKDIVTTHTTNFPPGPNYPFTYEELLNYARRISKTTMPPAAVIQATRAAAAAAAAAAAVQSPTSPEGAPTPQPGMIDGNTSAPGSQQNTNVMPSAAGTPSQPQSPALNGAPVVATPFSIQQASQPTITSLPEVITQYLNPLSGQVFYPWPMEEKLRYGAMAANQILVDQGIDPRGYDPAEEEERKKREEEERKEKEERERIEQEEEEKRRREEMERRRREREKEQEKWRQSISEASPGRPAPTGEKKTKQFQFASLDDDLDDDDDD